MIWYDMVREDSARIMRVKYNKWSCELSALLGRDNEVKQSNNDNKKLKCKNHFVSKF